MVSTRLSRFQRSPDVRPCRLTTRDVNVLRLVHRHRFLRSSHLHALIGGSRQQLLRRLQLLYHHGQLERPRTQLDYFHRAGSQAIVYGLGNRGVAALRECLARDDRQVAAVASRLVGRLFLEHALLVSDVMVALETACDSHGHARFMDSAEISLTAETRRLSERFRWSVKLNGSQKLGVIPDRVFALEFRDGDGSSRRVLFFVEADCGTMPVTRRSFAQSSFHRKLLAYEATWAQGIHQSRFGIHRFRVLTVTSSPERVQHLAEACRKLQRGQGLFLFTDRDTLSRHPDALSIQWQTVRGVTESLL